VTHESRLHYWVGNVLIHPRVRAIGTALMPFTFDRVCSHHFERVMHSGAKRILQGSVERYIAAIRGAYDRA
jgi:hypothetical protein